MTPLIVMALPVLLLIVRSVLVGLISRELDQARSDVDQLRTRVARVERRTGVDEHPTGPIFAAGRHRGSDRARRSTS